MRILLFIALGLALLSWVTVAIIGRAAILGIAVLLYRFPLHLGRSVTAP